MSLKGFWLNLLVGYELGWVEYLALQLKTTGIWQKMDEMKSKGNLSLNYQI